MNPAERVARALYALLERGEFDSDGDFCLYVTDEELALQEDDEDSLGIAEVIEGYAALAAYREETTP